MEFVAVDGKSLLLHAHLKVGKYHPIVSLLFRRIVLYNIIVA